MSTLHVLVTGASGFVGRHLVAELLVRGFRVRALARDVERARSMPWFDQIEFVAGDLQQADAGQVASWVDGIDVLVHLAWSGLPNYKALFHLEQNLIRNLKHLNFVLLVVARCL